MRSARPTNAAPHNSGRDACQNHSRIFGAASHDRTGAHYGIRRDAAALQHSHALGKPNPITDMNTFGVVDNLSGAGIEDGMEVSSGDRGSLSNQATFTDTNLLAGTGGDSKPWADARAAVYRHDSGIGDKELTGVDRATAVDFNTATVSLHADGDIAQVGTYYGNDVVVAYDFNPAPAQAAIIESNVISISGNVSAIEQPVQERGFHGGVLVGILLFLVWLSTADAAVIPDDYRIDWSPVGAGTIPVRTNNIIDVSAAPFNAPTNNGLDASPAIDAAITFAYAAYTSGGTQCVLYLPGNLVCSNAVIVGMNGITLRGDTNGSVYLKGGLKLGRDASNFQLLKSDVVTNGMTKGSTTIVLNAAPSFPVGEMVMLSGEIPATPQMQVIQNGSPVVEPKWIVTVTNISVTTVKFFPALPFDFTNGAVIRLSDTGTFTSCGLENLNLTGSNSFNGELSSTVYLVQCPMTYNSWMTNCSILWSHNYAMLLAINSNWTMRRNTIRFAQGSGSNHAGLLVGANSCLIEDNIFAEGLQPAIELNGGSGNVFFGNFFTNNLIDMDNHGPHPMMDLWEQNHLGEYPVVTAGPTTNWYGGGWELDGYFGSASHQTLLRNAITGQNTTIALKRWSSYCAIVGNVLGNGVNGVYHAFSHDTNGVSNQIIELGRPNIGNVTYEGTNPPIAWNFPGHLIDDARLNGIFVITNTQVGVTNIVGNFTNIPSYAGSLLFQDAVDTNKYWPRDGIGINNVGAGTATNLIVTPAVTVSNGWRVYFVSQLSAHVFQQLNTTNRATHIITGNYDYFNIAQTWDANGTQTIPDSFYYGAAPSWWGGRRWPAVQPDSATLVTAIPAQDRYAGIDNGSSDSAPVATSVIGPVLQGVTIR